MKLLKISILIIFIAIFPALNSVKAQTSDDILNKVEAAIKGGNSVELAKYFNSTIDLELLENDDTYSKTQAELIIKNFFKKYPPKSFSIKQKGSSNDGSKFSIGIYNSTNNKTFRTYFLIKKVSGKYKIHLLQFEEE